MIQYRSGRWGIKYALQLKGSVFPKALAWAVPCSLLSVVLQWVFSKSSEVTGFNLGETGNAGANTFSGFTFILGFLVVFRSQQAYLRWWEGCMLLQQLRGEWFNSFSSCLAFCNSSPDKKEDVAHFQHKLVRLMSVLYGAALTQVSEMSSNAFEFLDLDDFDPESMAFLEESHYKCEVVLQWVQRLIVEAHEDNTIKTAPPILSRVYNQLANGIVILSNAEKLNDFPMPFPVAQTITFMLLLHWLLTAVIVASAVEHMWRAAFIAFAVTFAFWCVHYIGMELEQPFGDDDNDLPMREMQADFNAALRELMDPRARFPPAFNFQKQRHEAIRSSITTLHGYLVDISADAHDSEPPRLVEKPQKKLRLQGLWADLEPAQPLPRTTWRLSSPPSCSSEEAQGIAKPPDQVQGAPPMTRPPEQGEEKTKPSSSGDVGISITSSEALGLKTQYEDGCIEEI